MPIMILRIYQTNPGTTCSIARLSGGSEPPQNRAAFSAETTNMFTYSPAKKVANFIDEYSVWNPATSSDSASGRSKGARLVSPTIEITKTTKLGGRSRTFHRRPAWDATMSAVDSEPA